MTFTEFIIILFVLGMLSLFVWITWTEAYNRGFKDGAIECGERILPVVQELADRLKKYEEASK